jgi:hypothetical protein
MWGFQANPPAQKSVVGTVTGFQVESAEIVVKSESGEAVTAKIVPSTIALKVAPGETNLANAQPIKVTDIAPGDRVLATLEPGTGNLRRIVVIAASDIARRNAADRADWAKRGVSGVVASKKDNEITVRIKTLQGESHAVVTVGEKTSYKRYSPDSVKFSDAKPGKLAEIALGDELRARGQKSDDGLKVTAEEVVFGTFETRAGTVTAIDASAHAITVKDMATNKPLVIKVAADTVIKTMPDAQALAGALSGRGAPAASPAAGGRGGAPAAQAPAAAPAEGQAAGARGGAQGAQPQAAATGGRGAAPASAGSSSAAGRGAAGMSITQLLDAMPAGKFESLKTGQTVVASATKGATKNEITAITLVANADLLIQIAEAQAKATALTLAAGGLSSGGGVQLPGMSQ